MRGEKFRRIPKEKRMMTRMMTAVTEKQVPARQAPGTARHQARRQAQCDGQGPGSTWLPYLLGWCCRYQPPGSMVSRPRLGRLATNPHSGKSFGCLEPKTLTPSHPQHQERHGCAVKRLRPAPPQCKGCSGALGQGSLGFHHHGCCAWAGLVVLRGQQGKRNLATGESWGRTTGTTEAPCDRRSSSGHFFLPAEQLMTGGSSPSVYPSRSPRLTC